METAGSSDKKNYFRNRSDFNQQSDQNRERLTSFVRFLARQAAENDYNMLLNSRNISYNDSHSKEGDYG